MSLLKVVFEDKEFRSQKDLLQYYGVALTTFWGRKQRGLTMRQCLGLDPIKPRYAGWREMGLCDENGIEVDRASYRLYEIVNLINKKTYIGITTQRLSVRWNSHVYDSLTKTAPLYLAMRKYGVDNFDIRLIRDDAKSGAELMRQEIEEIKSRNTTDRSIGYNLASGGSRGNSKTFAIDGQIFPSLTEAASQFGIPSLTFNARIRNGATPEQAAGLEPMSNLRGHVVVVDGKQLNLMDAVTVLGKDYRCINTRIRRGWTYRQAFDFDPPPPRLGRNKRERPIIDETSNILS